MVTDSLWFEIAIVSIIFTIGNMLFGHFEEHTSKVRRVGKYLLIMILVVVMSIFFGRTIALSILLLSFIPVIYIHAIVLPKKGINGWTAEPKDKYYEFRGWDKKLKKSKPPVKDTSS